MINSLLAYVVWFGQVCRQEFYDLRLRWLVWRYPEEARVAAVQARWRGVQDNDPDLLAGADFIEQLLARRQAVNPAPSAQLHD